MTTLQIHNTEIRTLDDLRSHFDLPQVTAAFLDGSLEAWLSACYYEREAEAIRDLPHDLTPAVERQLAAILGVELPLTPEEQAQRERKRAAIRRHDESLVFHAAETATDQQELVELLEDGLTTIYLCEGRVSVPIRRSGIHYIGIGSPHMEAPFTEEQYRRAGITFEGIVLPTQIDQSAQSIAEEAAAANGYDDFAETHCPLAVKVHDSIKVNRIWYSQLLHTNTDDAGITAFPSRWAAEKVAKKVVEKAYRESNSFFQTDHTACLAPPLAAEYAERLQRGLEELPARLCALTGDKRELAEKLIGLVNKAPEALRERFEQELRENTDFYGMYEESYFIERVTIEKNDYSMDMFDSDFLNGLARLIQNETDYNIDVWSLFEIIREMEEDVNKHADAFYSSAYYIYRGYCREIENLAEEIGKDLSGEDLTKLGL